MQLTRCATIILIVAALVAAVPGRHHLARARRRSLPHTLMPHTYATTLSQEELDDLVD